VFPVGIAEVERQHRHNSSNVKSLKARAKTADSFIMDAFLQTWKRKYIARGGRDPSEIKHTTLRALGFLKKAVKRRIRHGGNPCQYYIAKHTRGKKFETAQACRLFKRSLKRKYDNLAADVKVTVANERREERRIKAQRLAEEQPQPIEFKPLWGAGDATWPIAPHDLQAYANRLLNKFHEHEDRGISRAGQRLRAEAMQGHLVPSPEGKAPPPALCKRCWEEHPGLCRQRDAGILRDARDIAERIASTLAKTKKSELVVGTMWRFIARNLEGNVVNMMYTLVAYITYSPRLVVFLVLDEDDEQPDPFHHPLATDLWTALEDTFTFATAWGVAKSMLSEKVHHGAKLLVHTVEMSLLKSKVAAGSMLRVEAQVDSTAPKIVLMGPGAVTATAHRKRPKPPADPFEQALHDSASHADLRAERAKAPRQKKERAPSGDGRPMGAPRSAPLPTGGAERDDTSFARFETELLSDTESSHSTSSSGAGFKDSSDSDNDELKRHKREIKDLKQLVKKATKVTKITRHKAIHSMLAKVEATGKPMAGRVKVADSLRPLPPPPLPPPPALQGSDEACPGPVWGFFVCQPVGGWALGRPLAGPFGAPLGPLGPSLPKPCFFKKPGFGRFRRSRFRFAS